MRVRPVVWLWRVPGWVVVIVVSAASTQHTDARIWTAVLLTVAAVATQFAEYLQDTVHLAVAVSLATLTGLAATLLAPSGLGEIPAYIVAGRIPFTFETLLGRAFIITDAALVSAVVGYVSHSFVGLLAGLGIPLLAQRAIERRQLIASRDEAQALLVEVQAGREAEAQAAALQERGRIARDLHDVLAHSLAGLSVQLQAARAVATAEHAGPKVLEPLDRAAQLARDGLNEARAVVGTLREPIGLGIGDIAALVARHPGQVRFETTGEPVEVPADAGHALYRMVQEALTNAARYAPGAEVTVTLAYRAPGVVVTVEDSGGRAPVPSMGSGLGLAGMSERLSAAGGSVTAGPRPEGGWRVCGEVRL